MTKDDIIALSKLARIELTEQEVEKYTTEMAAVLEYVSEIKDIVGDDVISEPVLGVRHNIFRQDEVTNAPNSYTEDLLKAMPKTEGRFLVVKKILDTNA